MSIRLRLTMWYSGLLAATLVVFGVAVYFVIYHNTMQDVKDKLKSEGSLIQTQREIDLRTGNLSGFSVWVPTNMNRELIGAQTVFYGNNPDGVISDKSPFLLQNTIDLPYPNVKNASTRFVRYSVSDAPFYVLEVPIVRQPSGEIIGLLQVAAYINKEEALFAQLRTILIFGGIAGLVLAFLLGLFLSRKALRPIGQVAQAVEQIQSGSDLSVRLQVENQDEIGRLTHTLNHMLERIEGAYKGLEETYVAQRRFVSDASHELRTPLTTIRGNVDFLEKVWGTANAKLLASDREEAEKLAEESAASKLSIDEREQLSKEAIHDIADEARRMSRLVNDLLSLARADAGYDMPMERVELKPLAEEAARRAAYLPRTAEWKLGSLEALEGVAVRGNRDYLLQLMFIFIENGFKYTPSGEVRLEAYRKDDMVGFAIADTGIGIKKEEVPRIFDRFYRVDVSRGQTQGTGLGLSIAKWIADMHGATLEVRTKLGEGTTFVVWLPIDFSRPREYGIIDSSVRPELPDREST